MNELVERREFVDEMEAADRIFCSITAKTEEERIRLYNVMNAPENRVSDMINMEIEVSDVIVETVNVTNEEGVESAAPRVILVSPDGTAYQCVSNGVYSAIRKAIKIFGAPHWDTPKKFIVKQIKKGQNSVLTLMMR